MNLQKLHNAYIEALDDFDYYNVDDDYEAQKINEYYSCTDEDIVELVHWKPVAKKNIVKTKEFER